MPPSHAAANGQQQSQSSNQPSSYPISGYGDTPKYSGIESSGIAYQNPRTDYSYTGARSPVNTTALGSLAYASSLRQDRSGSGSGTHPDGGSLQRVADYNRATPTHMADSRSSRGSHSNHSIPNNSRSNNSNPRHEHQDSESQNPQNRQPPSASFNSNLSQSDTNQNNSTSLTSRQTARHSNTNQTLRLPSINGSTNNQNQTQSVPANPTDQSPTTIDPNKVFNEYEYQKRQAVIAAEVKANRDKAEAEARQAEAQQAERAAISKTVINQNEAAMKEQMETEMKLMLEKMRDYKSKDPSLFSQIWEQVKKAQPPTALPASKEVSIPSPRVSIASPQLNGDAHKLNPSPKPNATQPDPNSQLVQESAVEEDRGKFPAARRRGKLYKTRPSIEQPASVKKAHDPSASHPPGPPVGYVHAGDEEPLAPTADNSVIADHSHGHVPAGGVEHNDNRSMQKVWVSGKGRTQGLGRPKGLTPKKRHPADKRDEIACHDGAGDKSVVSTDNHFPPANNPAVSRPMATKPPPPRPTGQTHWPEDDKWALAIAARDTLLSHPANRGKQLLSEDIRNLLDMGPSYEELCAILEGKGFVVDRTPFAQQLLSAVPRLKQQRPPDSAQSPVPPPSISQPDQRKFSGQGVLVPVAHMYDNFRNGAVQAPVAKMSSMVAPRQRASPKPPSRATPINTKEQNAKKRTFNEIVDLTVGMDSDEELDRQRAEKQRKIESIKSSKTIDVIKNTQKTTDERASRSSPPSGAQSSAVQSDEDVTGLSRFKSVMSPERERLRKARDVIRPMNRALALQRPSYNPRTIARDILVAAGKHPIMPPLNYHLDGLKTKFRHVEITSDLSTFNWALIDPGGPPPIPRQSAQDSDLKAHDVESQAQRQDEPVVLSASSKRPEIRVAVSNGADGKHGIAASKPANPPKGFFAKRRSLPHSQGFMPSRPSFGVSPSQPQAPSGQRVVSQDASDVSMLGAGEGSLFANKRKGSGSKSAPATPHNSLQSVTVSSEGPSGHRRRGRPPGVKNRNGNFIAYRPRPKPVIPDFTTPDPKSTPGRLLAPSTSYSKTTSGRTSNPSTPDPRSTPGRLQAPLNSEPKHLSLNAMSAGNIRRVPTTPARPSGLRNELTVSPAAGFAVVIPSPPKRAGQISKLESKASPQKQHRTTTSPAPIPKRQVYKCRWQDCLAELHNLETLRKHVHKHMDEFEEDNDYECLWAGCGNSRIGATGIDERDPLHFTSAVTWERHMDGRHLDQYAWDLGDGPSPHPSGQLYTPTPTPSHLLILLTDAEASDYLSDSQQRQVTPKPSPKSRRPDVLKVPPVHLIPRGEGDEREAAIDAYHDVHGITSKKQKARAEFEAQLQKRRAVGSGITKGGTSFVDEKRRKLLSHDGYEIRRVEDESD